MSPFAVRRVVWPTLEPIQKPLTPSPSPRKRGEGSWFWDSLLVLVLLAGCGAPSDQGSAETRPGTTSAGAAKERDLPKLGDYLPPLDKGRIELAPPEGWYVPPASSKYVVRVQKSRTSMYPSVIVTAEDYRGEGIFNVSSENVGKFAEQIAAALKKDRSAVKRFERGNFVGVAHAKRGKVTTPVTKIIEMLRLETVVAGRKYRIELRSEDRSLQRDQPYLFAVVDGIRFPAAGSDEKPKPAPAEKAKEPPQEGADQQAQPEKTPKEEPKKGKGLDLDKLDELLEKGVRNLLPERPGGCFAQKVPDTFFRPEQQHS